MKEIVENPSSKYAGLVVATLSSFLVPFMGSSINVALPSIEKEFSMNIAQMGWIATAYLLASAVFMVPCGRLADIHGRKKIFFHGVLLYTVSSVLCAFSSGTAMLVSLRGAQGIGCAMMFSTNVAMLIALFPPKERGKALGINVAAVYCGLSAGPFLGGILTQQLGWKSLFWVNGPLGVSILLVVRYSLKGDWQEAKGEKFDYPGALAYGGMLVCLMYGLSLLPSIKGAGICLLGFLGSVLFVRIESRSKSPVFNASLFRENRVFAFGNLAALINYSATYAVTFLLSLYLQYLKKLSPQEAGLVLVSQPIVMALFSPLAGYLSDKVEPRKVSSLGMACTAAGLYGFLFLQQETSLDRIVANLVLLGFGFALFSSPNMNAVMGSIDKKLYSVASATLGTMRLVGQMLSMGISMLVSALYLGNVKIASACHSNFLAMLKVSFLIFAILCSAGVFVSRFGGRRKQEPLEKQRL